MYVCMYVCVCVCRYVLKCKSSWVIWNNDQNGTKICVDGNFALLGYYAASSGNSLPTFRDNISVPTSRSKNPKRKMVI